MKNRPVALGEFAVETGVVGDDDHPGQSNGEAAPIYGIKMQQGYRDWRYLHLREYTDAIDECRRSINLNRQYWYTYPDLIVAYQAMGKPLEAKQAMAELYQLRPEFTVERYQQLGFKFSSNPRFREELVKIFVEGMRRAGVR